MEQGTGAWRNPVGRRCPVLLSPTARDCREQAQAETALRQGAAHRTWTGISLAGGLLTAGVPEPVLLWHLRVPVGF